MKSNYVLYKHTNKINGKVYIGITNSIKRRWRKEGIEYKPEAGRQSRFWGAIQKYGWNNFKHEIVLDNLSFEQACRLEKEYISKYNSTERNTGYNIAKGGNGGRVYEKHPRGMLGKHQTEKEIISHRRLLSNPKTNPMKNGQVVWGVTNPHPRGMKGHHQSQKHKEAMKKLRGGNHPNANPVTVYKPDGSIERFESASQCYKKYNFYKMWELLKSGRPYRLPDNNIPNRKKCAKFDGWFFRYDLTEDTEVTH